MPEPSRVDLLVPRLIAEPFPDLPAAVADRVVRLQVAAAEQPESASGVAEVASLQRPWDPATCEPDVRYAVWSWVDEVAAWINSQHLWSVNRPGIPECWPQHPHLANELVVVAFERYLTSYATSPMNLAEWQRSTLPLFLDRISQTLGSGCQPGRHVESPRSERNRTYAARGAREQRRDLIDVDATS
ncbi:hypothetical protein RDV89_04030 [Nocardioides zeae]|uniref:DUF4913 domain-containing protein n=1 Tax=Nocardioides imazamoxiresistens TaxID=3231893 RepID=A0ABU3PSK0_9ACTN|nr:hypothetical protein [Nocardioides zeae]MDT9592220.1 hypothetical protein [Nocardioides zeae]